MYLEADREALESFALDRIEPSLYYELADTICEITDYEIVELLCLLDSGI
jgi:hypothetical protein